MVLDIGGPALSSLKGDGETEVMSDLLSVYLSETNPNKLFVETMSPGTVFEPPSPTGTSTSTSS